MKKLSISAPIPFLCCLAVGLLFDTFNIFRITIISALLHEMGHIAAYIILYKKLPSICFSVRGISMQMPTILQLKQENIILLCGPLTNLFVAITCYAMISVKASIGLYLFFAINIMLMLFNLLPFGMLDGARLIKNIWGEKLPVFSSPVKLVMCFGLYFVLFALSKNNFNIIALAFMVYSLGKICAEN